MNLLWDTPSAIRQGNEDYVKARAQRHSGTFSSP